MTASPNDDGFYLFYHGATKPEKSGIHNTALVCKYYYGTGKAWDLRTILAGRLQISCFGDFYGSLPLSTATQRQ